MNIDPVIVVAALPAISGLTAAVTTAILKRRTDTGVVEVSKSTNFREDVSLLIDQLQEEQKDLRSRVGTLEHHERIRDDYIVRLRQHISDGLPPPPPEWPEALRATTAI